MTDNMAIMTLDPNSAVVGAKARYETLRQLTKEVLVEGIDYGTIPGTDKPCLYKAGSEKLCSTFGLNPHFEILDKIENFSDEAGLFHYTILCKLININTGLEIATGIGSCNSKENRYRWRWVREDDIPSHLDKSKLKKRNSTITEFEFAINKAETSGKYGKPAEYWAKFEQAMADGTAIKTMKEMRSGKTEAAWSIGGEEYRIPNDEIFTLTNTIQKMACKRALVAATLIGTNASEFYTQDIEDMNDFSAEFVVGKATSVTVTKEEKKETEPEKKTTEPEIKNPIQEERERLLNLMVGEGKTFPTVVELAAKIKEIGYPDYASMREKLSYEAVVNELTPKKPEPTLPMTEPAATPAPNGKAKAK